MSERTAAERGPAQVAPDSATITITLRDLRAVSDVLQSVADYFPKGAPERMQASRLAELLRDAYLRALRAEGRAR